MKDSRSIAALEPSLEPFVLEIEAASLSNNVLVVIASRALGLPALSGHAGWQGETWLEADLVETAHWLLTIGREGAAAISLDRRASTSCNMDAQAPASSRAWITSAERAASS